MKPEWDTIFELLKEQLTELELPSVSLISKSFKDPYLILVSTMISLRTKDKVTLSASKRLFSRASTPESMLLLSEGDIETLIYPAGFYKTKAVNIRKISEIIVNKMSKMVPANLEELLTLPGVGRKTANLVLSLGFGKAAICVDTHVHRISNRAGWVTTTTPGKTEDALTKILPVKYWIPVNETLVLFGQNICTPVSPRCSRCLLSPFCEKKGVLRRR